MFSQNQGSVAALGYRDLHEDRFPGIVCNIDAALQMTDQYPRRISWDGDHIAMIDRDSMRIALGFLPPSRANPYSYLILAVGTLGEEETGVLGAVPNIHLVDRLLLRVKDDLPYDTIMRGETPVPVDAELVWSLFEMLVETPAPVRAANADARPCNDSTATHDNYEDFEVIAEDEVSTGCGRLAERLSRRAPPTKPLRLTVHMTGLTVMLASPPLGAFMFTYSMLRDVTAGKA